MKRMVVWFWVLVVVLVAQTQNSDKVDVETFLENIKKMLQETVEKMRKQQENRMKRRKDKKNKIKTRKMLMNKLANPYVSFRRQHTVIDYKKEPNAESNRSNLQEKNNKTDGKSEGISNQTINKVLKSNPVFNPFRTDRLKDILSKIQRPQGNVQSNIQNSSTTSGTTEPDHQTLREKRGLENWLDEVYSKIDWFWDMVYRLFILDEKRFEYLSEVLCKEEITIPYGWYYSSVYMCSKDNLPDRFKVIRLNNPTNMPCNSLDPHKLKVNIWILGGVITCKEELFITRYTLQCTPSLYMKTTFTGNNNQETVLKAKRIYPRYASHKSLCYNLAALNFFGYKRNLVHYYNSSYISSKVSSFIQYVQFMERIYKEKIIPALVDMCYGRCLCEDIGIKCKKDEEKPKQQRQLSTEELILLIAWNLLKGEINVIIESLYKFEGGINRISDDCSQIKDEFKNIVKLDYIRTKLPKLNELKNKIDEMESSGKIDTSYYENLLKLAGEVKSKLSGVKESLIKLWKEKIEKIERVEDLKCVVESFNSFISDINVNGKNALELYWYNLIGYDFKDKIKQALLKIINTITTCGEMKSFLSSVAILVRNGMDKNIIEIDKEKVISTVIKDLEKNFNSISTIGQLFEIEEKCKGMLNEFKNTFGGDMYSLLDVLKKGEELKLTLSLKIKAYMRLTITSYGLLFYYTPSDVLGDVFTWVSMLDYQIYFITEGFNLAKCIINDVNFRDFVKFTKWKEYVDFLECFIMKGKKISECNPRFGIIETVMGKDITRGSLWSIKESLDKLNGYNTWGEIPTIKDCCMGECKDVETSVIKFCKAVKSPDFKVCCQPPLSCCNPNSTTFCLDCSSVGANQVKDIDCSLYSGSIAYLLDDKCRGLASDMLPILLDKTYWLNGTIRKLLCDMKEKYNNFCDNPVDTLNNVRDDGNNKVVELKCGCDNCKYLGEDANAVCNEKVNIDYSNRIAIEEYLKKVELLEEARNVIRSGFSDIGKCPFTK